MDIERIIGLILLSIIFISSSINKLLNFNSTYEGIVKKGLPIPLIATIFAIVSQLGGLSLIYISEYNKNKILRYCGKYLIVLFVVLATYFYHNMFIDKTQTIPFMKNTAIIGGLILI